MNPLGLWREQQVKRIIRKRTGREQPRYGLDYRLDRDGRIVHWDIDALGPPPDDEELRTNRISEATKEHWAEEALVARLEEIVRRWRAGRDPTWRGNREENGHPECEVRGGTRPNPNRPSIGLPSGRRIEIRDYDKDRFGEPPTLDDLVPILQDVLEEEREKKAAQVRRDVLGEPMDDEDAEKLADEEAVQVCSPARYMRLLASRDAGDDKAASELNAINRDLADIDTRLRDRKQS